MKIRIDTMEYDAYGILDHSDYEAWVKMLVPLIGNRISITFVDLMGIGEGPVKVYKHPEVDKKFRYQLDGKSILTPYGYMSDQVYSGHYHAVMLSNKSEEVYRSCYRDAGRPSCYTVQFPELPIKRSEYPTERKRLKKLLAGCGIDLVLNEKEEVLLWRELFVTGPFRMMNDASMEEAVYAVRSHGMHIIEKAMERSEYLRGEYIEIRQQEIVRIKNTCKVL